LNSKQNKLITWGSLLRIGILGMLLAGCGGDKPADTASSATPATTAGQNSGGMPMGSGGMQGMNPMGGGPMGGGARGSGAAAAPPVKLADTAPPAHRPDPYKPWWVTPPPPVLSTVPAVRIAALDTALRPERNEVEIKEIPNRRVAGILSGHGVYALLDGPEGQQVVKPGDSVGDYRVDSINSDSVTLKKVVKVGETTQTYTQVVPLSDIGTNTGTQFSAPGGVGMRRPGGMGSGGLFPGSGGRLGGGAGKAGAD
jgi:hypothetical protein